MSITLATAVKQTPAFNLYLEEQGKVIDGLPSFYRLVMPEEDGALPDSVMSKRTGIVIVWPVNPHNTGESMILQMLNNAYRHGIGAKVTHTAYSCDQYGRFYKN